MSYDFQTTTHGKWILVGEHAVIRGHAALVFPINEKSLRLRYFASPDSLSAQYQGDHGGDTHLLFWSVIEQGVQLLGQSINHLHGRFELDSNIPIGVGMGASAALCMAVARWFVAQGKLQSEQTHTFARELEHLFHGQSSGLDIAGVAAEQGIYFKQGEGRAIKQAWQPRWFLSSCGQVGITSHCIQQVQTLWEQDPTTARALDQQMSDCVSLAEKALEQDDSEANHKLVKAIESAAHCFQQWGLISESLQQHMQVLRHAGAMAVKPTGSGGGGYVISLWKDRPPELPFELISM